MGTLTPGTELSITPQMNQSLHDPLSQSDVTSDDKKGILLTIPDGTAASDGESPGSPRTFTSASSEAGMGVTYDFPTAVDESVLPAWAAEGLGGNTSHVSDRRASDKTESKLPAFSILEGVGVAKSKDSEAADGSKEGRSRTPFPSRVASSDSTTETSSK